MNQHREPLNHKREEALKRLRQRRGEERHLDLASQETNQHEAKSILKHYLKQEKANQEAETIETVKSEQFEQNFNTQDLDTSSNVTETIKLLRESIRDRRANKKQPSTETHDSLSSPASTERRQQLISELLSADFLENTQLWLTKVEDSSELSSTSLEELEEYRRQVIYRMKVLKIMLENTQSELDKLEVQIRAIQSEK